MSLAARAAAALLLTAAITLPHGALAEAPQAPETAQAHAWTDVGPEAFADLVARGIPVIDVRTPEEWRETGIIPGSKTIMAFNEDGPVESFPDALLAAVPPGQPIAFYCRSGNRSAAVASFAMKRMGYTQVYNLEPGIKGWLKTGRPVTPWTE
jgi:rhodanese-related sulfurtransferase